MLLRVFFLDQLTPTQARAYLGRQAAIADEAYRRLADLRKTVSPDDHPLSWHGLIALEHGLRLSAAEREWAEWAQSRIPDEASDTA